MAGAVSHPVDAAGKLEAALLAWWDRSPGDAMARIVSGVHFDETLSGLNVDGDLVAVVPHARTERQLARVRGDWGDLGQADHSARVLLLQSVPAVSLRAGSFTLRMPLLDSVSQYESLVGLLREQLLSIGHAAGCTDRRS